MYLCYVDESGDSGTLNAGNETDCPVFVLCGLAIHRSRLPRLTNEFILLKHQFFPGIVGGEYLDSIREVTKGVDIRSAIRKGSRRNRTHAIGYLDRLMELLTRHQVRLLAKALVKKVGAQNSDAGFYGAAIMHVCEHFQALLAAKGDDLGQVVADSRRKAQNTRTTHTIFTQMYRAQGNRYPNLTEMPTYGHPENHAMLQITDSICSGIIFPMLTDAYCLELANVHVTPQFTTVRNRYKDAVKTMQFRYQNRNGGWRGGIIVTDGTGQGRKTSLLFQ